MSEESAKAFLKKVSEDKELQEKLKGVDSDEKFFAFTKAAGFDFTKEEWISITPEEGEELSDEDLGAVGGGHNRDTNYRGWQDALLTCWGDPNAPTPTFRGEHQCGK